MRGADGLCEGAFFCSLCFLLLLCFCTGSWRPMADCESCSVVVMELHCWRKNCGVVVVEVHCWKKVVVLLLWSCMAGGEL